MIIDIFLPLSLVFIMFTLGLGLTSSDFTNLIYKPKPFFIGIMNQMLILPLVAFIIISTLGITKEVAVGMMILASCPGGVTSNMITKLAQGDTALSISYTAVISILTIFTLPIITGVSMNHFMGADAPPLNILSLGLTMFFITAVPVGIGMLVRSKKKSFADTFDPTATRISTVLFVIIILGALASEWDTFVNNFFQLGPAIVLLIVIMLFVAYTSSNWLKMNKKQSITVAIESGIQNGTVGITVGNLILNPASGLSILSIPSGVYSILMYFICLPFVFWYVRNRSQEKF
ncbi:MAG: bile acid:sodium symporter family protein [Candidatus Neomarinimicrobiota bacterium]|nr:bile acid:sodium symporter [Candidatus Neomarinimicrobiota bacterium]MEC7980965.1 bile acid:sodium symporter family protein [Candidatus Neomarinimicrobiota bacterium]|tara:strand:+ start:1160 stop:2029 length:870 start_codon:yes stop_codon:yes gene_type:complete